MGKKRIIFMSICLSIFFVIPTIFLAVSSFIIGANNTNTQCDDNGKDIIRLSSWLFTNSTVAVISMILYMILIMLFFAKEQYKFLVVTIAIYILNCIFVIVWNIIGAIELFKNASACQSQAGNLWTMVLISLVFQWVNLSLVALLIRYDCSNIIGGNQIENNLNSDIAYHEVNNIVDDDDI